MLVLFLLCFGKVTIRRQSNNPVEIGIYILPLDKIQNFPKIRTAGHCSQVLLSCALAIAVIQLWVALLLLF